MAVARMVTGQWERRDVFIVLVNNSIMYIYYGDIHSLPFSFHSTTTDVVSLTSPFPFVFYKLSSTYDERQAARPRLQAS